MKYVFFDIECADGGRGTICSFGYLITDENFNEIFSRDMLVNPEAPFHLEGRVGRPDVKLAYTMEDFMTSPNFYNRYKEIKSMLEGDDISVVGYSVLNDIGFLVKDSMRYKLPGFDFKFYDVQKIFCNFFKIKDQIGLAKATEILEIESPACEHRSDDDARQAMLVLKELCKRKDSSFKECFAECPDACGEVHGLDYYQGNAHYYKGRRDPNEKMQRLFHNRSDDSGDRVRVEKEGYENCILRGRANHLMFMRFLDYAEPTEENGRLAGKTVSISLNYEQNHFTEMIKLIQLIINAGGKYIFKASLADIFVENPEETDHKCTRLEYVKEAVSGGAEIKIISFDELLALLDTNKNEFDVMPKIDTEYLLDKKYKR